MKQLVNDLHIALSFTIQKNAIFFLLSLFFSINLFILFLLT